MTLTDIPAGPAEQPPAGFYLADAQAAALRDVLAAAGVDLGQHDNSVIAWLAQWEWSAVATIGSWVARANQQRPQTPPVTLPGRFDATPAEIDQHLRRILAEDTYLRYQQAIGGQAVKEAAQDARERVDDADIPGSPVSTDYVQGHIDSADHIDPAKDGGPYPSQLQCSQHDGFGPCPGAPRCTPREATKGASA